MEHEVGASPEESSGYVGVCVCVFTKTGCVLWVGGEASFTLTLKGTLTVNTVTVGTHTGLHTLVHICSQMHHTHAMKNATVISA